MGQWKWLEQIEMRQVGVAPQPLVSCRLRWTEHTPATTRGVWQVTTLMPPLSTANWHRPPGLIASGDVTLVDGASLDGFGIAFKARRGGLGMLKQVQAHAGGNYYVRVVGLDRHGQPAGLPSNPVTISYKPATAPPSPPPTAVEQVRFRRVRYTPSRPQHGEAHLWFEVTRTIYGADNTVLWLKGQKLKIEPAAEDKNVLETVVDAVGDVASFVADAVNWVSTAYADLKQMAVDIAVSALPCPEPPICRSVAAAALDYGMTAMGMPPSLPNFDQLCQMGKGYLVETMAAELSEQSGVPVPLEAIEAAVDAFVAQVATMAHHGPSGNNWLRPDPDKRYRPPLLEIELVNAGAGRCPAWSLKLMHELFGYRVIDVPSLAAGQALTIPLVLTPDYRGYEPVYRRRHPEKKHVFISDSELKRAWWDAYSREWHNLLLSTGGRNGFSADFVASTPTIWQP